MSDKNTYIPPKVWQWDQESGGKFASINRPISGATQDKEVLLSLFPPLNRILIKVLFNRNLRN